MKSIINSEVIPGKDCRFFSLLDTSVYNKDLEITNAKYKIILPNFGKYVEIFYTPNTVTVVNTNLLKLTVEELGCIPDGLYQIEQSICPNDKLYKWINYYHICTAMTNLGQLLCGCIENKEKVRKIWEWRMELEDVQNLAACGQIEKANTLYQIVSNKISVELKQCNCGLWM